MQSETRTEEQDGVESEVENLSDTETSNELIAGGLSSTVEEYGPEVAFIAAVVSIINFAVLVYREVS